MAADKNPLRGKLTPERARAELDRIHRDPELRAMLFNKNHPLHAKAQEERFHLYEVLTGEPAPAGATPAPSLARSTPERRIFELRKDPAFLDRRSSNHEAKVAEWLDAHRELSEQRAAGAAAGST